jgi:hypothetical protein
MLSASPRWRISRKDARTSASPMPRRRCSGETATEPMPVTGTRAPRTYACSGYSTSEDTISPSSSPTRTSRRPKRGWSLKNSRRASALETR